jgi:hypothetical protein
LALLLLQPTLPQEELTHWRNANHEFFGCFIGFVGQNIGRGNNKCVLANGLKSAIWMSAVVCISVTIVIIIGDDQ